MFGKGSSIRKTQWGKHSKCNPNCVIWNTKIGNYVGIAWNVTIGPRSHVYTNFTIQDFVYSKKEMYPDTSTFPYEGYICEIGHDVWIGCNAVIMPGVKVDNGAIVAAGSIVTKSVPAYAIVGGNPARIIGHRFEKDVVQALEQSGWYNMEIINIKGIKNQLERTVNFDLNGFYKNYVRRRDYLVK